MKRSEYEQLLQKLTARREMLVNLTTSFKSRQLKRAHLAELQANLAKSQRDQELEEQKQMETFGHVSSELNTLRNPTLSPRLISKDSPRFSDLEKQLLNLQETAAKRANTLEELKKSDTVNQTRLGALLEKNQEIKRRFRKLEKLKVRQPPPVPLIFQIEELEAIRRDLEQGIREANLDSIPQLRLKIEAKHAKNKGKQAELCQLGADCDSETKGILLAKQSITSTFAQLESLSASLQSINTAMKDTLKVSQSARSETGKLRSELKRARIVMTEKVTQKKAELAAITKKIEAEKEKVSLLAKRKVLVEQLERKIEEARADLIQRQSSLPVVQQLTTT
jgi:hypothetical protein